METTKLGADLPCQSKRLDTVLVQLAPAHTKEAVKVASDAFLHTPELILDFICGPDNAAAGGPDAGVRRREITEYLMEWVFALCVHEGRCFGIRDATGALRCVAFCMPPGAVEGGEVETPARVARNIARTGGTSHPLTTPEGDARYGPLSRARTEVVFDHMLKELHARVAPGRHWYLFVLGVSPEAQGSGYGSVMLDALLDMAHRDSVPVYLETAGEANRDYYKRRGFRMGSDRTQTDVCGSLTVYGMLAGGGGGSAP